ncbi:hypothetical protein PILCRDRAFT_812780 [Piloderma croceum F 1598]|uniref:F-box domain-containing protein n=1 Tax=Piloderma croceum (strain F 1598) TaxID=765440 RepID=A0A0C3G159_PILCF|nr:hypothetical protein PILCRDRAFT_812780 [Piloderma croceum F 1598]
MSMVTLPLELINEVIDYVPSTSIADLRTLRIVSRTFKTLATPRVFRVLHVTASTQSVQRLKNVHESDELRHFVEKVVFLHEGDKLDAKMKSKYMEVYKFTKKDEYGTRLMHAMKKKDLREYQRLEQLRSERDSKTLKLPQAPLFRLHKFTRLNTVHFSFYPKFMEETSSRPSTHLWVQKSVLASLTSEPCPLTIKDLSLAHLICVNDGTYETPAFQSVISSLHSLSFLTVSNIKPGCLSVWLGWFHEFWPSTAPERFLVPALSSLTSLSFGGDEYIDNFNFDACYFPRLTSLKLRGIVFSMFHTIDDFVIKHGATLRRLELEDNGMDSTDDYYWSEVWERFQTELAVLEKLVVHRTDYVGERCCQPYIRLDDNWIFKIYDEGREQKEDADALEKLQAAVELRKPLTWSVVSS